MTKANLCKYRRQLQDLAEHLRGEVGILRNEALAAPTETAEQAAMAGHEAEESRTRAVLNHEESILEDVLAALERITEGKFGQCPTCGQLISHQRLDAVPYSRYCVGCAVEHDSAVA